MNKFKLRKKEEGRPSPFPTSKRENWEEYRRWEEFHPNYKILPNGLYYRLKISTS